MSSPRSTPLSRISRPGSAVDLIMTKLEVMQEALQEQSMVTQEQLSADQEIMSTMQAETRQTVEEVKSRLDRLEMLSGGQMAAGLSSNPTSKVIGAVTHPVTVAAKPGQWNPGIL